MCEANEGQWLKALGNLNAIHRYTEKKDTAQEGQPKVYLSSSTLDIFSGKLTTTPPQKTAEKVKHLLDDDGSM